MRDTNPASHHAGQAIAELLEQIARLTQARGYSNGLNPAQWSALRYFSRADEPECTVTGFAKHHQSSHGTASQTITALVRKGCLERKEVPNNRRTHRLVLTDEGRKMLEDDPVKHFAGCIDDLPAEYRISLTEALQELLESLRQD